MHQYLIEMFGISLLLTLVIELTVAGFFGIPFGKQKLPVVLVNVLTNPVVVLLCWLWRIYFSQRNVYLLQIPLEGLVVLVEYLIYKSLKRSGWRCKRPFGLALTANGVSWLLGILISWIK